MKLLAPEVVGPLSVCSKSVRIKGNITGATVRILLNRAGGNTEAVSHVSTRPDAVYDIGVPLQANDIVTAEQELNNDTSPTSLPVTVQGVPEELNALTIRTNLHECGRAIRMNGGVPGANVEGKINNQLVGKGELISGSTYFTYDPVLRVGDVMVLKQLTCNDRSSSQSSPPSLPQPSPLLPPLIQEPLIECSNTITVDGVTDGAFVEMYRNQVLEKTFTFSTSREWRWIKRLEKGDVITVRQGFKCKQQNKTLETASEKTSATVKPVNALKAPKIVGQPCPGTTYVTIANLIPGARVVLLVNDQELGQTDAPDAVYTFTTPPLPGGQILKAFMVLCGKNGPADTVAVSGHPIAPQAVRVSDLHACAAFVFVQVYGTDGNCLVYMTNKQGQQISAYHNLFGEIIVENLIPVSPSLVSGDEITVHVMYCGGGWLKYGPFVVSGDVPSPPEIIEGLTVSGYKVVQVMSKHAGAVIDVYVNNQWKGSAISWGNMGVTVIPLSEALKTDDEVFGTQTLCGKATQPGNKVKAKKPRPEAPILLNPVNDAQNVSLQPLFQWKDPGAGLENEAESFRLVVGSVSESDHIIDDPIPGPNPGTEHQSSTVLQYSTRYHWEVVAENSTGGTGSWSQNSPLFYFKTEPPPADDSHS